MNDRAGREQETDLWWGSYSGWTMLPSMIICAIVTMTVILGAWFVVERRNVQLTVWGLVGAIWFVQIVRFSSRVFGITYRLTTQRLLVERGHWRPRRRAVPLQDVIDVKVKGSTLGPWTKVGRVIVKTTTGKPVVLKGVHLPDIVAERIRTAYGHAMTSEPRPSGSGQGWPLPDGRGSDGAS